MHQRLFNLIDQNETKIAFLQSGQRLVDGDEFTVDFIDMLHPFRPFQSLAQQGNHFAVGAAALALILV